MTQKFSALLDQIIQFPDLQEPIREAIRKLFDSHLIRFLRERVKIVPQPHDNTNYTVMTVKEAGRVEGYQECIDDIEFFFERFVSSVTNRSSMPINSEISRREAEIDFALRSKIITEEDAKRLKDELHGKSKLN